MSWSKCLGEANRVLLILDLQQKMVFTGLSLDQMQILHCHVWNGGEEQWHRSYTVL